MTRLLDVMEDYLTFKQYCYLRLDGHTAGNDRGALIDKFNQQDSPFFIFLLRYNFLLGPNMQKISNMDKF